MENKNKLINAKNNLLDAIEQGIFTSSTKERLEEIENKLADLSSKNRYDIILASNIFYWLYLDEEEDKVEEYKNLLEKFDCPVIQALYSWSLPNDLEKVFLENGFSINSVSSAKSYQLSDDKVVSLCKKRK